MRKIFATLLVAVVSIPAIAQSDGQSRKDRGNATDLSVNITNSGGQTEAKRRENAQRGVAASSDAITHCDRDSCFDDKGGVYRKTGTGTITSPNGRICKQAGLEWVCD
jgi:putative hemolysin